MATPQQRKTQKKVVGRGGYAPPSPPFLTERTSSRQLGRGEGAEKFPVKNPFISRQYQLNNLEFDPITKKWKPKNGGGECFGEIEKGEE